MVYIIQRQHFICLHHSQLQEMPSNGEGSFCSGRKNISLWRSEEKRTVTSLDRGNNSTSHNFSRREDSLMARSRLPSCPSTILQQQCIYRCIFFRCKSSVCGLVLLAPAGAAAAAQKVHDLSIEAGPLSLKPCLVSALWLHLQ